MLSRAWGECERAIPPHPSPSHSHLPTLLWSTAGFGKALSGVAVGPLTSAQFSHLRAMGPIFGSFKFSEKLWGSCFSPQDAFSRQPSHVPLRSWEMDYFTQAFANDGSNLNLQVGVDGRNFQASVSIPLAPPPPASAPHLWSLQRLSVLL